MGTAIFLISHTGVASGLLAAVRHVHGELDGLPLAVLEVAADEDPVVVQRNLADQLQRMGDEVLLITDLAGATPDNLARKLASERQLPLVSGVNLAMLLRAINYRQLPASELAEKARDGGVRGIEQVGHALS